MAHPPTIRVGWLSTASIGRKNAWALAQSGAGVPLVVGSRDGARAAEYAAAWGFARSVGAYDAVLADGDVDAVYVPLPTGLRCGWAAKAVAAGKHVLLDKPCATSLAELQAVCAAAAARGLQLMDGVMFMHNARLPAMAAYLHAGEGGPLGAPRVVTSTFGFRADAEFFSSNIRTQAALEPAGVLGDLTWYDIRLALFAFGYELPSHAACDVHARGAQGVPTEATTTLYWPDGRRLVAFNSFHIAFTQSASVVCTRGSLALDDFVLNRDGAAFTVVAEPGLTDCDRVVAAHPRVVAVSPPTEHGHQEAAMWRTFCGLVAGGRRERFWPEVALKTQAVLDAVVASAHAGGCARVAVAPIGDDY
jgi:hypothetical protein